MENNFTEKSIVFVAGRAKSGKSAYIRDRLKEHEEKGEKAVLIVPARFTFETEKALSSHFGGGMLFTSVCSIQTLMQRVLTDTGKQRVFLSPLGILMVIKRVLCQSQKKLGMLAKASEKTGFAKECYDIINSFINCKTTPEQVLSVAEKLSDDENHLLKQKLLDLGEIYLKTDTYLKERKLDILDAYNEFIDNVGDSFVKNCHIYIDGMDSVNEQTYRMLEAFFLTAKSVTVSVRMDLSSSRDEDLFSPEKEMYLRLKNIANDRGLSTKTIVKKESSNINKALIHLEKELFAYPFRRYAGSVTDEKTGSSVFTLLQATDKRTEIKAVVNAIKISAMNGTRYREMAIIVSDEEKYNTSLCAEFEAAKIPIFIDVKTSLGKMSVTSMVLLAIKCIANSFNSFDIFSLIKTGYTGLSEDEAEKLENYMLEYGLFGSEIKKRFSIGKIDKTAEIAREKLYSPLEKLQKAMSNETIGSKAAAVIQYLSDLNVREALINDYERFKELGDLSRAELCCQLWNSILSVFEQLNEIMGDIKVSNSAFLSMLEEGFNSEIVNIIPAEVDAVLIGSVDKTIPSGIKKLFVLGATEGALPRSRSDTGIISDSDLAICKEEGLSVWQNSQTNSKLDMLEMYTLLTLPTEGLYISYPLLEGKNTNPACYLALRLTRIFPEVKFISDIGNSEAILLDNDFVAAELRQYANIGKFDKDFLPVYAWYLKNPEKKEELSLLKAAAFYRASPGNLEHSFAEKLYENGLYGSPSKLELFNGCPFSHFARYGLKAKERKEFKPKSSDIGSFCHEVLEKFVAYIIENKLDCQKITDESADSIIEMLLPDIMGNFENGILIQNERQKMKCQNTVMTIKCTARAMLSQMRSGGFSFYATEVTFGDKQGSMFPPIEVNVKNKRFKITGKIDRMDIAQITDKEGKEENVIRVIDYKLGGKDFLLSDLYYGLKLQLPLYLYALEASINASVSAGMYYMPISEPKLSEKDIKAGLDKAITKEMRLKGLSVSDIEIFKVTDTLYANEQVSESSVIERSVRTRKENLITKEEMDKIKRFALKKASETAEKIMDGNIQVSPCEGTAGGVNSCSYCPYNSVCTFDKKFQDCSFRKLNKKISLSDLFDELI